LASSMWLYRHEEYKGYGAMETSIQVSEKSLGDQAVCDGFRVPTMISDRAMCGAVLVKDWGPQEVRSYRNQCGACAEGSCRQPCKASQGEAMWPCQRSKLPKLMGARIRHNVIQMPDMEF
jgi:hypothetical protein